VEHVRYSCDGCGKEIPSPWELGDWVIKSEEKSNKWIYGRVLFHTKDHNMEETEAHLCNKCIKKAMSGLTKAAWNRRIKDDDT
jgi:hypothetical protein